MIGPQDVVIFISYSGRAKELDPDSAINKG